VLGVTVRVFGPHALSLQYVVSARDASFSGRPDRDQSVQTISLAYNFLGQQWRPAELRR
jgi:hypothetical protein